MTPSELDQRLIVRDKDCRGLALDREPDQHDVVLTRRGCLRRPIPVGDTRLDLDANTVAPNA